LAQTCNKDTHTFLMDFRGQTLAEQLYQIIIVLSGVSLLLTFSD